MRLTGRQWARSGADGPPRPSTVSRRPREKTEGARGGRTSPRRPPRRRLSPEWLACRPGLQISDLLARNKGMSQSLKISLSVSPSICLRRYPVPPLFRPSPWPVEAIRKADMLRWFTAPFPPPPRWVAKASVDDPAGPESWSSTHPPQRFCPRACVAEEQQQKTPCHPVSYLPTALSVLGRVALWPA